VVGPARTLIQANTNSANGTAGFVAYDGPDQSNAGYLLLGIDRAGSNVSGLGTSDFAFISSSKNGTGKAFPLIFGTGSTQIERMRIDTSGNVGIGTTAPASTLEVTGNIMMSQGANRTISVATTTSNTAGNSLTIRSGTAQQSGVNGQNGGSLYLTGGTGYGVTAANSGGNVYAYGGPGTGSAASNGNVILAHNGTSSVGNVGIGTTSPGSLLDVVGGAIRGSAGLVITGNSFFTPAGTPNGSVLGLSSPGGNPGFSVVEGDGSGGALRRWDIKSWSGKLIIHDATAGIGRAVFDTTGNVGIGTTSPGSSLHIGGSVAGQQAQIKLDNGIDGSTGYISRWIGRLELLSSDAIGFATNSYADTKMLITNSGYVGIGTASPQQALHVNGYISTGDAGIKWKVFTGTSGTNSTTFAHGVDWQKIVSVSCSIYQNGIGYVVFGWEVNNHFISYTSTNINIMHSWDGYDGQPYRCTLFHIP